MEPEKYHESEEAAAEDAAEETQENDFSTFFFELLAEQRY